MTVQAAQIGRPEDVAPGIVRDMVWIGGGEFRMGSDHHYPEEAPAHCVRVDGFHLDPHPVTNRQFAAFVAATGYRTVAERPLNPADYPGAAPEMLKPGSMVFRKAKGPVDLRDVRNWWAWTPGAYWRHPEGRGSSVAARLDHPVVQVAFEDAEAYATWVGKALPTEAEWEFAARGGLDGAEFAWGSEFEPGGRSMANTWHGDFPWRRNDPQGIERTSPVGSFPTNGYGLFDMVGNVWEWTTDWFSARHAPDPDKPCCIPENPRGGSAEASHDPTQPAVRIPRKVVKGGSFLCAPSYCRRYRPAARHAQMIDSGMSHVGFRCVVRPS
ncbi:MAG TPA: formylglycine-generating enzyme family protein [Acetobacteraceae bacterium]|nr:formylglycine-generating enzyme family protein [Acetobacteraceae bacterium]